MSPLCGWEQHVVVLRAAKGDSCWLFLLPSAVASKHVKSECPARVWPLALLCRVRTMLAQASAWLRSTIAGAEGSAVVMVPRRGPSAPHKVTVVVSEPPLCWDGSAGGFGVQGGQLVWDGCSRPRVPRIREQHPPQPSLGTGVGVGAAPPGREDPAPSAWVCCCPRGSGDSPGPISLKYPQNGA